MALAAKRNYEVVGHHEYLAVEAAEDAVYFKGAMLVVDANGFAAIPSDAAGLMPAGVYTGNAEGGVVDAAFAVGLGAHPKLEIERGRIYIPKADAAQTDVGALWYLADDEALTAVAGAKTWAVPAVGWKTGYLLIDFGKPVKVA